MRVIGLPLPPIPVCPECPHSSSGGPQTLTALRIQSEKMQASRTCHRDRRLGVPWVGGRAPPAGPLPTLSLSGPPQPLSISEPSWSLGPPESPGRPRARLRAQGPGRSSQQ
ncbi:unnamed protein product [Rangifer tarandus platyrhynchus]|uniref:Uncharacterized protein n=1 Tax=Rangifer tarandus platyrhynchus TaxID=3082113 RepID=A0AC59Y3Z7_RANTA